MKAYDVDTQRTGKLGTSLITKQKQRITFRSFLAGKAGGKVIAEGKVEIEVRD
jgi:hypothetical protein